VLDEWCIGEINLGVRIDLMNNLLSMVSITVYGPMFMAQEVIILAWPFVYCHMFRLGPARPGPPRLAGRPGHVQLYFRAELSVVSI